MLWRGIMILFSHFTVVILILSGFHWLEQGIGLNPLIAFPSAIIIFCWTWLLIAWEANKANTAIEDYLEWLDFQESLFSELTFYESYETLMTERNKAYLKFINIARDKIKQLAT